MKVRKREKGIKGDGKCLNKMGRKKEKGDDRGKKRKSEQKNVKQYNKI